jgi:hypothetical protein
VIWCAGAALWEAVSLILIFWAIASLTGFVLFVFRRTRIWGAILCVAPSILVMLLSALHLGTPA